MRGICGVAGRRGTSIRVGFAWYLRGTGVVWAGNAWYLRGGRPTGDERTDLCA